jgi:dienelactone hydrolase
MFRKLFVFALLMFSSLAHATDTPEKIASAFLDKLDAGDYAAAEAMFTPTMLAAVPADKLKAVWETLPQQMGAAKGRGAAQTSAAQNMQLVIVPLNYANGGLLARIAIDTDGKIAGFVIQPAPAPAAAPPAASAGFSEHDFAVPSSKGDLPGTLALPDGTGPFPAVVLVHGSGPNDRDETIGPNRPFLDIARALAAQGIAVLRYEKRTKARPQDFTGGNYTMDDETTFDAVNAIAALASDARIDNKRIFVFGHSQGAMLAPRIAQQSGKLHGVIMLAAPARSLLDILPEQTRFLMELGGNISTEQQAYLDDLQRKINAMRGTGEIAPADWLMGVPPHYWREAEKIHPVADAQSLQLPILLLQGGRDFQVIDTDWQLWKKAFPNDTRVTLKHYPSLNHLGIAGEGAPNPNEYNTPGHVDAKLIDDVAAWIKAR